MSPFERAAVAWESVLQYSLSDQVRQHLVFYTALSLSLSLSLHASVCVCVYRLHSNHITDQNEGIKT